MSSIINKSNHPVEIKKIPIRTWRLREEIEAAIAEEMAKSPDISPEDLDISKIKDFYLNFLSDTPDSSQTNDENEELDSNLDSSGNPMDDDAMAMMAALGGSDSEEDSQEEDSQEEDSPPSEEASEETEEDEDAAAMAAQMLADQGMATEENDAAADLAAQMLADQGLGSKPDNDAADLAAEMLADQQPAHENKEKEKPFKRIRPLDEYTGGGFVLLSDIQMDQILFFSNRPYIHGQNIIVEFVIPKPFNIMIEVTMTSQVGRTSKVITANSNPNRIAGKIIYKFPGERALLREFLQSIEPEIPEPPKKLKKPDNDDDDDDFDDLGF